MHDPSVLAAQNNLTTGNADIDAQLKEARRQAILGFGDSALASMAGFGLDPQDAAFARQNYLSGNATLARLDKAHELRRKAVIDRLAGRGMLFSGDTGYLEGQEGQQYGNEVYDARQNVLNYLLQLSQNSLQQRQSLRNMLNQSMQGAIGNYISNPAAYLGLFGNQGS